MNNYVLCRLWQHVSDAVLKGDQNAATNEKFILEEAQRKGSRERKAKLEEWVPHLFERDMLTSDWVYRYIEYVYVIVVSTVPKLMYGDRG